MKWFKQAKHDLSMAEKNITIDGYDVASFLAHQAVEKLLKAIIVFEGKTPPRSHYLDEVAKLLGLSDETMENIAELSGDYMISRYPDVTGRVPYEEYDSATAEEKVNAARKIFEQLKHRYGSMETTDE